MRKRLSSFIAAAPTVILLCVCLLFGVDLGLVSAHILLDQALLLIPAALSCAIQLLCGYFNLALGGQISLLATLSGLMFLKLSIPLPWIILLIAALCLLFGLLYSLVESMTGPAFGFVSFGLLYLFSGASSILHDVWLFDYSTLALEARPMQLDALWTGIACMALAAAFMNLTVYGRSLPLLRHRYLSGTQQINTRSLRRIAFCSSSLLTGVTSLLLFMRTAPVHSYNGMNLTFNIFSALAIGNGLSVTRRNFWLRALIGCVGLSLLTLVEYKLNLSPQAGYIISGLFLIVAGAARTISGKD